MITFSEQEGALEYVGFQSQGKRKYLFYIKLYGILNRGKMNPLGCLMKLFSPCKNVLVYANNKSIMYLTYYVIILREPKYLKNIPYLSLCELFFPQSPSHPLFIYRSRLSFAAFIKEPRLCTVVLLSFTG